MGSLRITALAVALLLMAASAWAKEAPGDIKAYLPADGSVPGWKQNNAPAVYRGENLIKVINGGADVYHEYGFKEVVRAEYRDARGKLVKLEIYEMKDPAAAYGVYSFRLDAKARSRISAIQPSSRSRTFCSRSAMINGLAM